MEAPFLNSVQYSNRVAIVLESANGVNMFRIARRSFLPVAMFVDRIGE